MSNSIAELEKPKGIKGYNKTILYWCISIILSGAILLIPTNAHFTSHIRLFFALTLLGILFWALEIVSNLIVSMALPVLYVISHLAPAPVVFSPWSNYIPWIILSGMILTNIAEETGLLKRVAYWSVLKMGGSYRGIIYGLTFSGVIMALIVTDLTARTILFATLSYGICKALDLENGGKASSGIMLAGLFAALNPSYIFLTSASQTMIAYQVGAKFGVSNSWVSYLFHNGLITLIWCFVCALILDLLFKSERHIRSKEFFQREKDGLGPLSLTEKKMVGVFALLVAAILTVPYHKIPVGWIFPLAACTCFLPGINLGKSHPAKNINFSIIVFVTATMGIGAVASSIGAGKFIADMLFPIMSGTKFYTLISVWVFGVLIKFLLTPLAAVATLSESIVRMAHSAGINPVPVLYVWNQSLEQVILPYEYALVLLTFGYGYLSLKNLIKAFSVKMLFNIIFIIAIAVPFWMLIGIF